MPRAFWRYPDEMLTTCFGRMRTVLLAAAVAVMSSPQVKQRFDSQGFIVPPQGSAHYTKFVEAERDRWVKVIKAAGIKEE